MTGQDILDLVDDRLGGYQNAKDTDAKMRFINDAKDEVWAVLKNLEQDYFGAQTQAMDSTQINYFGPLNTTSRQYQLPSDFREIRFIECITQGYEFLTFTYRSLDDPEFRDARRESTAAFSSGGQQGSPISSYYYTFQAKDQMILAQYPETSLTLVLFYVRALADFEIDDTVDEIVTPFAKKIADFAAQAIIMSLQDEVLDAEYKEKWRQDVITLQNTAAPRNQADATFVQDFWG